MQAVVLAHHSGFEIINVPGLESFNFMMLLHGEENVEFHKPLTPGAKILLSESIVDFADKKGKHAVLGVETKI
jgi:acyl dehydratase